jgi:DNA mismatch endonuclease (patch repair protein)
MDTVDKKTRSRIMASVGQKNTKPEMLLRSALHKRGFRYRLNDKSLTGSPDLVFPKYGAAIFVHGCFWHAHDCRKTKPASNKRYWNKKLNDNKARDARKVDQLLEAGWRVLIVWECAIVGKSDWDFAKVVSAVVKWLEKNRRYGEIDRYLKVRGSIHK